MTPIAEANVFAGRDGGGGGKGAKSSSDGTYSMPGLAAGNYWVRVDAQGYVKEFYDGTTDYNSATLVVVTAGVTVTGTDFTLEVGGSISGTVYQADGVTPIVNADVWAERDGSGGGRGAKSSGDGTYVITGLSPGSYRVIGDMGGYVEELYDNTMDFNLATLVVVTTGVTSTGTDFTLELGGIISGMVTEADGTTPIVGAAVVVKLEGGELTWEEEVEEDGSYTFDGLPPGQYTVWSENSGYVREYYEETADTGSATLVTVVVSQETAGINFTLEVS